VTRFIATLLCCFGVLTAWAEDRPEVETAGQKVRPRKVIRVEETKVEGRIQKPQAFYILQRSTLNFGELNKTESFVEKIEGTVEKGPF